MLILCYTYISFIFMFEAKKIEECVYVQLQLCGDVKKVVIEKQKQYFNETGRHLGKKQAIYRLITEKNL